MCNPLKPTREVRILGRMDDLIVLATGEKVHPFKIEKSLEVAGVKRAVAFGNNREEIGVLIELDSSVRQAQDVSSDSLWPRVAEINQTLDGHAQIPSKTAVIIVPSEKNFVLTDKGSISRETYSLFESEINTAYEQLQNEGGSDGLMIPLEKDDPQSSLREMVQRCLPFHIQQTKWSDKDDFIYLGMDSLQASRLQRILSAKMDQFQRSATTFKLSLDFIYSHPSVSKLAKALFESEGKESTDTAEFMRQLTHDYEATDYRLQKDRISRSEPVIYPDRAVVLLSGSTGTLGTHLLHYLAVNPGVERVICLVRPVCASTLSSCQQDTTKRQQDALRHRGISLPQTAWTKISLVSWQAGAEMLGLDQSAYNEVIHNVTHIFHGAWPMDFQ